jgi:hypothetical protein
VTVAVRGEEDEAAGYGRLRAYTKAVLVVHSCGGAEERAFVRRDVVLWACGNKRPARLTLDFENGLVQYVCVLHPGCKLRTLQPERNHVPQAHAPESRIGFHVPSACVPIGSAYP